MKTVKVLFPVYYRIRQGRTIILIYTQNVGTTNEYCANYNILWTGSSGFVSSLSQNANYATYGNYFLLPTVNFADFYTGRGTHTTDTGFTGFFLSITNSTETLGGFIQWVNGTIA